MRLYVVRSPSDLHSRSTSYCCQWRAIWECIKCCNLLVFIIFCFSITVSSYMGCGKKLVSFITLFFVIIVSKSCLMWYKMWFMKYLLVCMLSSLTITVKCTFIRHLYTPLKCLCETLRLNNNGGCFEVMIAKQNGSIVYVIILITNHQACVFVPYC